MGVLPTVSEFQASLDDKSIAAQSKALVQSKTL
jgi:hypothetical protein